MHASLPHYPVLEKWNADVLQRLEQDSSKLHDLQEVGSLLATSFALKILIFLDDTVADGKDMQLVGMEARGKYLFQDQDLNFTSYTTYFYGVTHSNLAADVESDWTCSNTNKLVQSAATEGGLGS